MKLITECNQGGSYPKISNRFCTNPRSGHVNEFKACMLMKADFIGICTANVVLAAGLGTVLRMSVDRRQKKCFN